jgi:hypothetical protein
MDELIPKRPFFERHEFLASLTQGDKSVDDLQVVVQFSLLKEGEIVGQVLGTSETFNKLAGISDIKGPKLSLRSKKDPDNRKEFSSDDVDLGTSRRRTWTSSYGNKLAYVVSELNFFTFEVTHRKERADYPTRHVVFFLSGPQYMWEVFSLDECSYTGETKVESKNTKIDIDDLLPFSIEVKPWFFYDKSSPPEVYNLTGRVLALEFSTSFPEEELSNESFIQKATSVAEDLILLVSFMSRKWITWYSYELNTATLLKKHIRRSRETSSQNISWHDTLVEYGKGRDFLKTAYTNLQKLRTEGTNLLMSIVYYLSGLEAKYLDEQFTTLFLALEWTKDLFAQQNQQFKSIISPTCFEGLATSIKEQIGLTVNSPDIQSRIYDKLPELNRPSLRFVLDSLLSKHGISYLDLYTDGEEFSLIKTRNLLFHSSKEIDPSMLYLEFYRLRSILERLLLALLGWRDFSRSPDVYMKKWFHEKNVATVYKSKKQ